MHILWQTFNEIVENQDLYRNIDDFRISFSNKKFLYFDLKDFILFKYNSIKFINCRMTIE